MQVHWQRLERLLRKAGEIGQVVTPQQPEGRIERFVWEVWRDRAIVDLLVYSDDMVVPMRRAGR
ncbi:hypothetical protein B1987_13680 [Mycobacterium kansasii]|nr:hypothetical protein B1987_13680 [Mycobacterium kansasii]